MTPLPTTVVVVWRWSTLLTAWCAIATLITKPQAHRYVKELQPTLRTRGRYKVGVYKLTVQGRTPRLGAGPRAQAATRRVEHD